MRSTFDSFGTAALGAGPLCVWYVSDRANRLAQVDTHPSGVHAAADSIRTCIDYDQQGNVRRVAQGCSTAGTCAVNSTNGTQSACVDKPVDYDADDFGDTVQVKGSWNSGASGPASKTLYEYNARGLVIKKETEFMRSLGVWLQYTHDATDRLTSVTKEGGTGSVLLAYYGYDGGNPGTSCPSMTNTGGRLAYRSDSFGTTWFSYRADGLVDMELRQRAGSGGSCAWGGSPYINNPSTTYTYSQNGNLVSVAYPYGRLITYVYGAGANTDRVASIQSSMWNTSVPDTAVVVTNIEWEPFGGLVIYKMKTGAYPLKSLFPVEYFRGSLVGGDTQETSTNGISCTTPELNGASDGTGRTRALLVTNSNGTPVGNILRQVYTWSAEQLQREQTCVGRLGQTVETSQAFLYDKTRRLVSSSSTENARMTVPFTVGTNRTYGYDLRGNRTSYEADACTRTSSWMTGPLSDLFNSMVPDSSDPECSGRFSGPSLFYDVDGRTSRKATAFYWWYADLNYTETGTSGGLDSVFKSVTVNRAGSAALNYSYRYDGSNRRRYKAYPFDSEEEFFYDTGQQLLSQRSGNLMATAKEWTVDDFIWLDGKTHRHGSGQLQCGVREKSGHPGCVRSVRRTGGVRLLSRRARLPSEARADDSGVHREDRERGAL